MARKKITQIPRAAVLGLEDLILTVDIEGPSASTRSATVQVLLNAILANLTGYVASSSVINIVSLTQAEYNALMPPNPTTLYIVIPE